MYISRIWNTNTHRTCLTMMYLQRCCRLCTLLNLDTGCNSWTLMGPNTWNFCSIQDPWKCIVLPRNCFVTGLRCRKKRYLPDLECSTAFSMNSTIVLLLNFVKLPKLKLPARKLGYNVVDFVNKNDGECIYFLPWSCSILTCRTNPLSLNVKLKISRNYYPLTGG